MMVLSILTEPEYHPGVIDFMRTLYENNFVQSFDWGEWQEEGTRLYQHPELLAGADLETCVKILTLHARKDRFCGGHLGEMVRCGHILAVLRRIQELRPAGTRWV